MDPANILLALEEQTKWRARRKRIQERIRQLNRRKAALSKELDSVRKKVSEYAGLLADLNGVLLGRKPVLPIPQMVQGR